MTFFSFNSKRNKFFLFGLFTILHIQMNAGERKWVSFSIDYKVSSSELCTLGAKYDTDKTSQRKNISASRHCHAYTPLYNALFRNMKDEKLVVGELGVLYGSSLAMWLDYFPNAEIFGFENDLNYIDVARNNCNSDRIKFLQLNVKDKNSMIDAFQEAKVQFDLIIDDTTHQFEDQIKIINAVYPFIKPGGMLIIEDIFKRYNEQDYINRLEPILDQFQDFYFVSVDHVNRNSTGWDNDKVFILVKKGAPPIFKNSKKMTIITPSMRPGNLPKVRESIDFDYVDEWIIVYDGKRIKQNPNVFLNEKNPKIKEYLYEGEGVTGNPQRNFGIDHVQNKDTFLYFLDDDNIIHKDLYKLLNIIEDGKLYTFNQIFSGGLRTGDIIRVNQTDTAMGLVDFNICKNLRWVPHIPEADGIYFVECLNMNKDKWIYVNNTLAGYNVLPRY